MPDAVDCQQAARADAIRLMGEGHYAAAAAALYRGLGAGLQDLSLLASLGRACLRAGAAEEAARIFRTCTERRRDPAYLDGLGAALTALGRPEEAERYLREAVARDPLLVEAWTRLGRLGRLGGADPLRAGLERAGLDEAVPAPQRALLRAVLAAADAAPGAAAPVAADDAGIAEAAAADAAPDVAVAVTPDMAGDSVPADPPGGRLPPT